MWVHFDPELSTREHPPGYLTEATVDLDGTMVLVGFMIVQDKWSPDGIVVHWPPCVRLMHKHMHYIEERMRDDYKKRGPRAVPAE